MVSHFWGLGDISPPPGLAPLLTRNEEINSVCTSQSCYCLLLPCLLLPTSSPEGPAALSSCSVSSVHLFIVHLFIYSTSVYSNTSDFMVPVTYSNGLVSTNIINCLSDLCVCCLFRFDLVSWCGSWLDLK